MEAVELGGTPKTMKTRVSCGRQSAMKMLEMLRTLRLEASTVNVDARGKQVVECEESYVAKRMG